MVLDKGRLRTADIVKNKELQDRRLVFSVTGDPLVGGDLAIPFLPKSEDSVQLDPYEYVHAAVSAHGGHSKWGPGIGGMVMMHSSATRRARCRSAAVTVLRCGCGCGWMLGSLLRAQFEVPETEEQVALLELLMIAVLLVRCVLLVLG